MLIQISDELAVELLNALKLAVEDDVIPPEALVPIAQDLIKSAPEELFKDSINDDRPLSGPIRPITSDKPVTTSGGLFGDVPIDDNPPVTYAKYDTVKESVAINDKPVVTDSKPPEATSASENVLGTVTINDKQWSALLNAGISHGMGIDKIVETVKLVFKVEQIKLLPSSQFQDALDILSGKTLVDIERLRSERAAAKKSNGAGFAEQAEACKIDMKQWTNLLNTGCFHGLGVDGTDALIKEKFGCRTRDLKQGQLEEAIALIKQTAAR